MKKSEEGDDDGGKDVDEDVVVDMLEIKQGERE